jgi:hypothetical protein
MSLCRYVIQNWLFCVQEYQPEWLLPPESEVAKVGSKIIFLFDLLSKFQNAYINFIENIKKATHRKFLLDNLETLSFSVKCSSNFSGF